MGEEAVGAPWVLRVKVRQTMGNGSAALFCMHQTDLTAYT
jgi:hypothetical protein